MDIALVKMDDTEYWDKSITEKAGRIYTYYIFDPHEYTYCCSLTPSLWLVPVHFETEKEISDNLHEEIFTAWTQGTEANYFTHRIKPDEITSDFDSMEEAEEYYQGNAPYIVSV